MSEKWGDWWFKTGQTTYEEHSVEKQFGSRSSCNASLRLC